jgi:hypothetical protein
MDGPLLNCQRYLTFEVGHKCNLAAQHPKCPVSHPDRYRFGQSTTALTDDTILGFWRWARGREFRGIILWHLYSEPTLVMPRLLRLMATMRAEDPGQPFQLFTNNPHAKHLYAFDLIKITDYAGGNKELDDRIAAAFSAGHATPHQPAGYCGRGWGWEVVIDHFGNWLLCCNDWRCEEAVGNLHTDDWPTLLARYHAKASRIRWKDQVTWEALPGLCRACMAHNFSMHRSGASFYPPHPDFDPDLR